MAHRLAGCAWIVAGVVLVAVTGYGPRNAAADDASTSLSAPASVPCEGVSGEKIDFISSRLDERRKHAQIWWKGFIGFYGIGTVVTSVQAATENDAGHRAVDI